MDQAELDHLTRFIRKPAARRKKQDAILVLEALRANGFTDYAPEYNPHEVGSLRHDRFKRYYENRLNAHRLYEPTFRDICEVYGYEPEKLNAKP